MRRAALTGVVSPFVGCDHHPWGFGFSFCPGCVCLCVCSGVGEGELGGLEVWDFHWWMRGFKEAEVFCGIFVSCCCCVFWGLVRSCSAGCTFLTSWCGKGGEGQPHLLAVRICSVSVFSPLPALTCHFSWSCATDMKFETIAWSMGSNGGCFCSIQEPTFGWLDYDPQQCRPHSYHTHLHRIQRISLIRATIAQGWPKQLPRFYTWLRKHSGVKVSNDIWEEAMSTTNSF